MKLNDLKNKLLERPGVRAEYDRLAEEFSEAETLPEARGVPETLQQHEQE